MSQRQIASITRAMHTITKNREWFNDPDYQEAMKFRHAASTMNYLLVQEGGSNTENPDPKLE